MADEISESVELRLIDTATLAAEQKKLRELKKLARDSDEAKKNLTSGISPVGFGPAPDRLSGVLSSDLKAQTRKGAVTGAKTANAFRDMQKKIKELEKKQKKAIKKIDDFQDKFIDKLEGAESFLTSGSISGGALGVFGGIAARFGPIGILIASAVSALTSQFFQEFERGGIFSTALPITEREKNIVDIDYVIDVRSGTKFLTSDLRIAQKAPETSNTLNLRYEHIRYTSQELGK